MSNFLPPSSSESRSSTPNLRCAALEPTSRDGKPNSQMPADLTPPQISLQGQSSIDQANYGEGGYSQMPTQHREIQRRMSTQQEDLCNNVPGSSGSSTFSIDSVTSNLVESLPCTVALDASSNSNGERLAIENVAVQYGSEPDISWACSVGVSNSASYAYQPPSAFESDGSPGVVDEGMSTELGVAGQKPHVGTESCQPSSSESSPHISTED